MLAYKFASLHRGAIKRMIRQKRISFGTDSW